MKQQPVIEISDLSYSYKSDWTGKKFPALQNISLEVAKGESFGFLGHNGAGKTTTIKCILNLVKVTSGSISIFGKSHTQPAARKEIGYLPEHPYFYDHLSVEELLSMSAALSGISRSERAGAIEKALSRVHLLDRRAAHLRSLSKGLVQRVGMAQAILSEPGLLILDEPFSGMDPIGRKQFRDLLFELKEAGTTIFVSSHILGDIEFLCDRAAIMAHGKLQKTLALSELPELLSSTYEMVVRNFEGVRESLVEKAVSQLEQGGVLKIQYESAAAAEKALEMVISSNAQVESFQKKHGSLEDLFVQLVKGAEGR